MLNVCEFTIEVNPSDSVWLIRLDNMQIIDGDTMLYTLEGPFKITEVSTRRNAAPFNQGGVYIIAYGKDIPVYVGQGKLMWRRIQGHMSSMIFGNFSMWNYGDNHRFAGFAKEIICDKDRDLIRLYEPGDESYSRFDYRRSLEMLDSLFVYTIPISSEMEEERKDIESNLIQLFAGTKNGEGARFLLANAVRPRSKQNILPCLDCGSWPLLENLIHGSIHGAEHS